MENDPISPLLRYHAELQRMAETVRGMYIRFMPLFILACAESIGLVITFAIKSNADPAAMTWRFLSQWLQQQPFLYVNLALLPPLFVVGYLLLLAVSIRREQFYENRARKVRDEIEALLQASSHLVLQRDPASTLFLDRVIHRPFLPPAPPPKQEPRIGVATGHDP